MSFHVECGKDAFAVEWLRGYMTSISKKIMTSASTRSYSPVRDAFDRISLRVVIHPSKESIYKKKKIREIAILSEHDFLVFYTSASDVDNNGHLLSTALVETFRLSFLSPEDACVSIVVPPKSVANECWKQLFLNSQMSLRATDKQKEANPEIATASTKEWNIKELLSTNQFASSLSDERISYIEFEAFEKMPLPGLIDVRSLRIHNRWTSTHVPRMTTEMLNLLGADEM